VHHHNSYCVMPYCVTYCVQSEMLCIFCLPTNWLYRLGTADRLELLLLPEPEPEGVGILLQRSGSGSSSSSGSGSSGTPSSTSISPSSCLTSGSKQWSGNAHSMYLALHMVPPATSAVS
jgi:hypothetical protein